MPGKVKRGPANLQNPCFGGRGVIRGKIREMRTDLATKADLAETKAEIIKWNIGTIMAAVGLTIAIVKLMG
ncbi:hypothetical protein AGMMS50256_29940 [Betaproteobacteria bacterium]|nr:hypothetical protein AGMMS50256_29940 [Betaproteobacteria bacterium]